MKWLSVVILTIVAFTGCQTGGGGPKMGTSASGEKLPYAKPVPGKEGLVYSPHSENNVWIDVRGFKRGTEVKDPWTDKLFLVP
jgi:hypothetical protein